MGRLSLQKFFSAIARAGVLFALAAPAAKTIDHRVRIEGAGRTAVVFESGLGDTLESWEKVQPAIAEGCARTFAYNRAGYPGSTAVAGVRDARTVVEELRHELKSHGVYPPYVLVGHSLGGLYMQYFARRYPDEIAGVVLVDSTHWNQQLLTGLPNRSDRRSTVMLFMSLIARRELDSSALAGEQVRSSPPARPIPTIVLSSTAAMRGETPATRAQAARLQDEIAADFPGARHERIEGSGHYIQKDRPEVVIRSVRELALCEPRA